MLVGEQSLLVGRHGWRGGLVGGDIDKSVVSFLCCCALDHILLCVNLCFRNIIYALEI